MKRESKCQFQVKAEIAIFASIPENSRIRLEQEEQNGRLAFAFMKSKGKRNLTYCHATIKVMVGASQHYGYSVSKTATMKAKDSLSEESTNGGCHLSGG